MRKNSRELGNKSKSKVKLKPRKIINQIYNLYSGRVVFVAVPVLMHTMHTVSFRTFTLPDALIEALSVGLLSLGGHQWTKKFFTRRKNVFARALVLPTAIWSKWHLTYFFALDFSTALMNVGFIGACIIGWKLYRESHKPPKAIWLSGAKKLPKETVLKLTEKRNAALVAGGAKPEYVDFIGLPLLSVNATTGFLIFGETRAGKTVLFTCLMKILRYPDKNAVIFDPSSNMMGKLLSLGIDPKRIINANAFHSDCDEWDFGKTFTNPANTRVFFTNVMRSAKAQAAQDNKSSSSDFFEVEAADLVTGVVMTLRRLALDAGHEPQFGLKELCYICTNKKRLIDVLQTYADIWDEVEENAAANEQNAAVFSTLKQVFKGLQPMAECYYRARLLGRTYDLKDFAQSDKILLLGLDEQHGGCYQNYFNGALSQYIITTILGTYTTDDTKPIRTLFIFDEFDKMGRMDLPSVSNRGGKYGLCLACATQSYNAMKGVYGDRDTNKIISSITHIAFLRVGESETDKFASEYFGMQVVKEPTYTLSEDGGAKTWVKPLRKSTSWVDKPKPLFEKGHFKNLNKLKDTGLLGVVVDCDGMTYELNLDHQMIGEMLPSQPTAEMLLENEKPQSEDTMYFKPLTDDHLKALGLGHLIKDTTVQTVQKESPQPTNQKTVTLNLDEIDFDDDDFEN